MADEIQVRPSRAPSSGAKPLVNDESPDSRIEIRKADREEIPTLQPMWLVLHRRHTEIASTLAGLPARSPGDSWRVRRGMYQRWLADDSGFLLIGEIGGRPVGYAAVHLVDGFASWQTGDRVAHCESMVVLPGVARKGIGAALYSALVAELSERGITELIGSMVEGNDDARRFFGARGEPVNTMLLARLPVQGTPEGGCG